MTSKFRLGLFFLILNIFSLSCEYPYKPVIEEPITVNPVTNSLSGALIKKIVPGTQVCNPSVSLDTIQFPACMLWLNFSGLLPVKTNDATSGYPKMATQHDRLTISDSSNTVRWYMMRDKIINDVDYHFQDPEWSAHPEYIGTLLGNNNVFDTWSFYAIHPGSNAYVKIIDRRLNEISTPHLWVGPGANTASNQVSPDTVYDNNGFLKKESVAAFFGTTDIKITWSIRENGYLSVYYVDYGADMVTPIKLLSPSNETGTSYNCESALISPDGNWIVFNAYQTTTQYKSYIQKLSPQSKPVLLKDGACDPHWWVNPSTGQSYIVYAEINGDYDISVDLADPKYLASGEPGSTSMLRVHLNPELPSALSFELGSPVKILQLPLKGGLSPDGHFLCTGYKYAYIVELF